MYKTMDIEELYKQKDEIYEKYKTDKKHIIVNMIGFQKKLNIGLMRRIERIRMKMTIYELLLID